jgi:hypothetical protein
MYAAVQSGQRTSFANCYYFLCYHISRDNLWGPYWALRVSSRIARGRTAMREGICCDSPCGCMATRFTDLLSQGNYHSSANAGPRYLNFVHFLFQKVSTGVYFIQYQRELEMTLFLERFSFMYAAVQPRESLCILKRNIARTTIFGFLRILQILVGYLLWENKRTKNHEKNRGKSLFQGVFISRVYAAVQIRIKAL